MSEFAFVVALVALYAAFVVLLVKKWGIAEWMQVHGDRYLSQMFGCDLCMSFWSAVLLCAIVSIAADCGLYMAVPLFSTPITRMLV